MFLGVSPLQTAEVIMDYLPRGLIPEQLSYSIIELYRARLSADEAFSWALITPDPSEWAPPLSMEGQNKQRWDLLSRMRRPEVVHEQFMRLDFAGTGERC